MLAHPDAPISSTPAPAKRGGPHTRPGLNDRPAGIRPNQLWQRKPLHLQLLQERLGAWCDALVCVQPRRPFGQAPLLNIRERRLHCLTISWTLHVGDRGELGLPNFEEMVFHHGRKLLLSHLWPMAFPSDCHQKPHRWFNVVVRQDKGDERCTPRGVGQLPHPRRGSSGIPCTPSGAFQLRAVCSKSFVQRALPPEQIHKAWGATARACTTRQLLPQLGRDGRANRTGCNSTTIQESRRDTAHAIMCYKDTCQAHGRHPKTRKEHRRPRRRRRRSKKQAHL